MNCRALMAHLDDYLAGDLAPETAAECEAHLRRCTDCANYLRSYEKTIRLAKEAGLDDDPAARPPTGNLFHRAVMRQLLGGGFSRRFGWGALALG